MKFIARVFMLIALVFLALDLRDAMQGGEPAAAAPDPTPPPAATETETGTGTETTTTAPSTTGEDGATEPQVPPASTDDEAAAPQPAPVAVEDNYEPNHVMLYSIGERWAEFHRESLLTAEPAVTRHVAPWLWGSIIQPILLQPGFLVFFFLSLLFSFFSWLLGRRRDDW